MIAAAERAEAAARAAIREVGAPGGLADVVDLAGRVPRGWVIAAVDVAVEELERYEEANKGMVVTDLNTERS